MVYHLICLYWLKWYLLLFLADAYVQCFRFSSSTRYIHIHVDFTLLAIGSLTRFPSEIYCTCSDNYNDFFCL